MARHEGREFTLRGGHVLAMLIAFFGVVFAVNGVFVYYSQTTWTGKLPGNGYEASIKYNKEAEKARRLLAKGWHTKVLVRRDGHVVIELRDRDGAPVSGLVVKARVGRPVGERDDRSIAFVERGVGRYVSSEPLAPGAWRLDAQFHRGRELVWRASAGFVVTSG